MMVVFAATALIGLLSAPVSKGQATNIYLAQSATGAANGADCADAYAYGFFNNSANWGSGAGQIGPGTTMHLCGTITGTVGQTGLTFQGSGASGNPVTLLFESGANLTSPVWGTAITINGKSHIVINGGTNGIIQNTANGTGLTYEQGSTGISLTGTDSDVTIQNLEIASLCKFNLTDTKGCSSTGINVFGTGASNIAITHCKIHDTNIGMFYGMNPGDTNLIYSYNTSYAVANTMQQFGGNGGGTTSGFSLIGNDMYCQINATCNWAAGGTHAEIVHFLVGNGVTYNGTLIANNYFHDMGTVAISDYLNLEVAAGATAATYTNFKIYNNVFAVTMANPAIGLNNNNCCWTNFIVTNNTIVGPGPANGVALTGISSPITLENNIISSFNDTLHFNGSYSTSAVDYNDYLNWGSFGGWGSPACASGCFTFSAWQTKSTDECSGGCDMHGMAANPNLNPSFVPSGGSPVLGKGANLSSLGIAGLNQGAPQFFGVNYACGTGCGPRPGTGGGAWDIGAYQVTGLSTSLPGAPPGLAVNSVQ